MQKALKLFDDAMGRSLNEKMFIGYMTGLAAHSMPVPFEQALFEMFDWAKASSVRDFYDWLSEPPFSLLDNLDYKEFHDFFNSDWMRAWKLELRLLHVRDRKMFEIVISTLSFIATVPVWVKIHGQSFEQQAKQSTLKHLSEFGKHNPAYSQLAQELSDRIK